jgi:hypothetical protein
VAALLGVTHAGAVQAQTEDSALHFAIAEVLHARNVTVVPTYLLQRSRWWAPVAAKVQWAEDWLRTAFECHGRMDERRAALYAIEALVGFATYSGAPLSSRLLYSNLLNVPTAVERAYPGYKAAKLLPLLLKQQA